MTSNIELNEILDTEWPNLPPSLADQQELRDRYEEQQRRLCCPSCGEEPFVN